MALIGNSFVTPKGWVALFPHQAKLLRPLTIGPRTIEQLAQEFRVSGADDFGRRLQARVSDVNSYLKNIGASAIRDGRTYKLVRI